MKISVHSSGVNINAESDPNFFILTGYAYATNIGWISFDVAGVAGHENQPRIDKSSGILQGYAWSPNVGWLTLDSRPFAMVDTGLGTASVGDWEAYD